MMLLKKALLLPLMILILSCPPLAREEPIFIAFSLREAALRIHTGQRSPELSNLGGITRVGGFVQDREGGDIILFGLVNRSLPEATLSDLVTALRARILYDDWPLVSIDPTQDTETTKLQSVRFDGHLENTTYGRSFLDSDITLKRYSLELLDNISSVPSFRALIEADIRRMASASGATITHFQWFDKDEGAKVLDSQRGKPINSAESFQARFWFDVFGKPKFDHKNDVFGIQELKLSVKAECSFKDSIGATYTAQERFPREWTEHFDELLQAYPELRRLKVLYDLTAVAEAIHSLGNAPELRYLFEEYEPTAVSTESTYKLEELFGVAERSDGLYQLVRVTGGIQLKADIEWLNDGDFTSLRDIVLNARPSPHALTWALPLEGWRMQNARDLTIAASGKTEISTDRGTAFGSGCSMIYQSIIIDPKGSKNGDGFKEFPPLTAVLPPLKGVSMEMQIDSSCFKTDTTGKLRRLREEILKKRPSSKSKGWPSE
jgi:hypothetical protein